MIDQNRDTFGLISLRGIKKAGPSFPPTNRPEEELIAKYSSPII